MVVNSVEFGYEIHIYNFRSNCHPGVASKLRELFPRPKFLPHDSESSAIDWIFIGSPGLGASMHVIKLIKISHGRLVMFPW